MKEVCPRKSQGPKSNASCSCSRRMPGLGPRSARKAVLALLKRRNELLIPLTDALAGRGRKNRRVPNVRQSRYRLTVQHMPRPAPRRQPDRGGRRGRRHLGAGTRQHHSSPLSRAWRPPVAARRHRALKNSTSPALLTRASTGDRSRKCCSHSMPPSKANRPRTTYPINWLPAALSVSRLAQGVPIGGELDYLDEGTLAAAFKARRKL